MEKWTKIFDGASYCVKNGQVTISTYRNGGHVIALTRLYTPSTFYWTNESEKFRYYNLRKSNNGIYPIYVVSLNKQSWVVISHVRFSTMGESIKVNPYTIFTDFADGNDTDKIVAGLQKKGLNLSSEEDQNNREMLKNLAETILFLRKILAGKADIHQWQRYPYKKNQAIITEKPKVHNGEIGEKTIDDVLQKEISKKNIKKGKASSKKTLVTA